MADYTVRSGSVFEAFARSTHIIIPHVCNNVGAWGKGFTEAIDSCFPFARYAFDQQSELVGKELLGCNIKVPVSKYNAIIHMVAQDGLRSKENPHPLDYESLVECMEGVAITASFMDASIHCPKFGAGLAGGDWSIITDWIHQCWIDEGIDVTVWEF